MFHVPNEYRIRAHPTLGSTDDEGNNGAFEFRKNGLDYFVIASDGSDWEHVSVHVNRSRCPTWEEMCIVKKMFWGEEDLVVQFHPPESEYVNMHKYTLHLWRNKIFNQPHPPSELIGFINPGNPNWYERINK